MSDSPVSSPPPGTPLEPPRSKRKRGRPRKVQGSSSTSTQYPDLSSDTDMYCFCSGRDDALLMVQCDQCDWWFHRECVGVTTQEVADLDQYIFPSCMGDGSRIRCLFISYCDSSDEEEARSPTRGWRTSARDRRTPQGHPKEGAGYRRCRTRKMRVHEAMAEPREIGLLLGNWNLADSLNGIL